jgi:purine catabolism regulator
MWSIDSPVIDGVSLAEVLALPVLERARVVGGTAGLARRVRSVNVMEVPDILQWVKPGELLLTTTYPLRDDRVALDGLVPRLAERGLAGIAVKPARYIDRIPESMVEAADRHDFTLIELPGDASFNEIINGVLTVILNAQAARLQKTTAIHDRFTAIVLQGGGVREIAEALAELIARPVLIEDAHGSPQWATGSVDARSAVVDQPIQVGGDRYGSILVGGAPDELSADRLEAVQYAATVAALRQVQARAVAEADRRFQAVCLEELVTGHVTDRAVLMDRAAAFTWDLTEPRAVLLAELEEFGGRPFGSLAGTPEEGSLRRQVAETAATSLGPTAIVWERSREIAALIEVPPGDGALAAAGAALQAEARRLLPGVVMSVGVGRPVPDPLHLGRSFDEARRALQIGRWSRGAGQLTLFDDLGLDRLLVGIPGPEVTAFCHSVLGPLEAHDQSHGTALVRTLDVYLASRNAALAARELYLHYNTLKNRLDRIEEIAGPFLDDPERCLSLSLALRLRRIPGG